MARHSSGSFWLHERMLKPVPLLVYADPNKPFTLYTDASDIFIGACLTKDSEGDEKPIYYLSHKLYKSQCKWSVVEKQTLLFVLHCQS